MAFPHLPEDMPATYNYKGHTYYLDPMYGEAYAIEDELHLFPMYRYLYGPYDDRMFLWVNLFLEPIEDLFDYDQILND